MMAAISGGIASPRSAVVEYCGSERHRSRRRRTPHFAPWSETPGGYVGQAVLEKVF
jgi:hypothetical protein